MAHQNQVDYAALQLYGGQLHFSFDLGKGKAVALHPALVSDGKWHTVGGRQSCAPFSLPWRYWYGFCLPYLYAVLQNQTGSNPIMKSFRKLLFDNNFLFKLSLIVHQIHLPTTVKNLKLFRN